jgi:hypothetical protein
VCVCVCARGSMCLYVCMLVCVRAWVRVREFVCVSVCVRASPRAPSTFPLCFVPAFLSRLSGLSRAAAGWILWTSCSARARQRPRRQRPRRRRPHSMHLAVFGDGPGAPGEVSALALTLAWAARAQTALLARPRTRPPPPSQLFSAGSERPISYEIVFSRN